MTVLIVLGLCAWIVSLALTPLFRDFFGFLEMVDRPDSARKLHVRPVPRIGGIALAFSYVAVLSVTLACVLWTNLMEQSGPSVLLLARLLPAILLIFGTGLLDDFIGLTPWQKIAGQVAAAGAAYLAGFRFADSGNTAADVVLALIGVAWLVFCANAFNLIDGLDGLASGVALLASLGFLFAALLHHHPLLALATVPLIGGLLGFLRYNFNPASVFLGDCGSLLIGFLVGCLSLLWVRESEPGLSMLAPLLAMALPAAEVGISITRRFLRLQPIFAADRNHFHHRLLSLGLTQKNATLVLYAVSAFCAVLAVLLTVAKPPFSAIILVGFVLAASAGIHHLRYPEFRELAKIFRGGELRRMLRMRVCLEEFRLTLTNAATSEDVWTAVKEVSATAGLASVSLNVDSTLREVLILTPAPFHTRDLMFPLQAGGEVRFGHDLEDPASAMWMAQIVQELDQKRSGPESALPGSATNRRFRQRAATAAT